MEKKKMNVGQLILLLAGILCILYFIGIMAYAGWTSMFHVIWLIAGVLLILFMKMWQNKIVFPKPLAISLGIIGGVGAIIFVILLVFIMKESNEKPKEQADYMIILGAQVNKTTVSQSLKYRLEEAIPYLEENVDTKVIVTGGKGSGEEVTEAYAMSEYLKKKGINENRIILEEKATNSNENIRYSIPLMKNKKENVVIVSNGFHIYRAKRLCSKQGLSKVSGLGAKSGAFMTPTYYVREVFAVVKDYLVGNIN